jgi:hypothetical protein
MRTLNTVPVLIIVLSMFGCSNTAFLREKTGAWRLKEIIQREQIGINQFTESERTVYTYTGITGDTAEKKIFYDTTLACIGTYTTRIDDSLKTVTLDFKDLFRPESHSYRMNWTSDRSGRLTRYTLLGLEPQLEKRFLYSRSADTVVTWIDSDKGRIVYELSCTRHESVPKKRLLKTIYSPMSLIEIPAGDNSFADIARRVEGMEKLSRMQITEFDSLGRSIIESLYSLPDSSSLYEKTFEYDSLGRLYQTCDNGVEWMLKEGCRKYVWEKTR